MSFTQSDINNMNAGNAENLQSRQHGWKQGWARATFDATSGASIAAHGLGLTIPAGSVILGAYYKVLTTFTSSTDAATIALSVVSANDLVSAVAISDGSDPWDDGALTACVPDDTLSNDIAVDADAEVTATVAVEALTAGKLVVWVNYLYHGDVGL